MPLMYFKRWQVLSQWQFPNGDLPSINFPRAASQVSIFQVANSQMCYLPSNNFPKVRLGPLSHSGLQWGPCAAATKAQRAEHSGYNRLWGGRTLRLGQTWEVVAWEIPHLGSYHLGKYPLEVAAWENAFGKVPNSLQNIINLTQSGVPLYLVWISRT